MLKRTASLSLVPALVFTSCRSDNDRSADRIGRALDFTVSSDNEPKNDTEALAVVGIGLKPAPTIVSKKYTAGLDDQMLMVIRFPKDKLDDFWKHSAWDKANAKRSSDMEERERDRLMKKIGILGDQHKDPLIDKILGSKDIISCDVPGGNDGLNIYMSLDLDENNIIALVEWFQT